VCTDITCLADEYVSSNECTACDVSDGVDRENTAGDNASGADTECAELGCLDGYYESAAGVCTACAAGETIASAAFSADTPFQAAECDHCATGYYESAAGVCTTCAAGKTIASAEFSADTPFVAAECNRCAEDYYESAAGVCTPCAAGKTIASAAFSADTPFQASVCTDITCLTDEYVSSNECTDCAATEENDSGDSASGADTECDALTCTVDPADFDVDQLDGVATLYCMGFSVTQGGLDQIEDAPASTNTNLTHDGAAGCTGLTNGEVCEIGDSGVSLTCDSEHNVYDVTYSSSSSVNPSIFALLAAVVGVVRL